MTTVVSLGGPIVPEAADMLKAAGITYLATEPYPKKAEILALLEREKADGIIVRLVERVDEAILRASPRLKVVAKHGAGTNDIDRDAAGRLGIPVVAAVNCNAHSVAEHALTLMLALSKELMRQDAFVRGGGWEKKVYKGRELRGQTLGLVGLGAIGRALAGMAGAIGMRVIGFDPFAPDTAFGPSVSRVIELDRLLAESDVVSLHCPLTDGTRNLIGAPQLRLMKPTAHLINTARGEVIDEPALVEALKAGTIAGAGLDTFAAEPPRPDNPLWTLPNVIASPHIGGVTEEARREVSFQTARNVLAALGKGGDKG